MKSSVLNLLVPLSLFTLLGEGCSGSAELSSSWRKDTVTIDGSADEWTSRLAPVKDTKILLGVQNDQDFVYVCLMSQEEQYRRQIMGRGLIVWFESEEGRKLGIHYPTGDQSQQELEILGPGKDEHHLVSILEIPGISAKVGISMGAVVYELKVPMRESHDQPYSVGSSPGSTLKVQIETVKFEPGGGGNAPAGGMGGGSRGGRRGGRGGGPPGGGGGREGGGRSGREGSGERRPDPIDIKGEIHLAPAPSAG